MSEVFDPRDFVRTLTSRPGVYRMLAANGEVLYVGKARDLRRRVGSYFSRRAHDAKTQAMLAAVARVEVTVTATESEALLLEYNLIKEHKPRFNVLLRDDKSYPYIHVTSHQAFPRFELYRGSRSLPGRYLGPFPHGGAAREVIHQLQKLFRIRQCSDSYFANRSRPCLQYQIQRCSAPCVGMIGSEDYARDVNNALRFVEGRDAEVLDDLVARMEGASAKLEYEQAARYRDLIADIRHVQERQAIAGQADKDLDAVAVAVEKGQTCVAVLMIRGGRVLGSRSFFPRVAPGTTEQEIMSAFLLQHYFAQPAPPEILLGTAIADAAPLAQAIMEKTGHAVALRQRVRAERRRWIEMAATNAREAALARAAAAATLGAQFAALGELLGLETAPERIECFDISHTQGGETVASCVVFRPTGALKSDYRRFNIEQVAPGDDYGAIAQAVERRYLKALKAGGVLPDLIIIDGGRMQLQRAAEVLGSLGLASMPLLAIAKGEGRRPAYDRLFFGTESQPLRVEPGSDALHLVQQLRDEAHRFALTGHRQRRARARTASVLETIPGLGPRRRRALLQQFGGLQGVSRAGVEDLLRTHGISRALAEQIYRRFHEPAAESG